VSIKVMTFVWESFPGSGGDLVVLLAMADHCDDEGGNIFPSVKTLARKSRMSERGVQKILRALEADGWIVMTEEADHARQRARCYQIPWRSIRKNFVPTEGGWLVRPGEQSAPGAGEQSAPGEQNGPGEPQFTPPVNPSSPQSSSNHHLTLKAPEAKAKKPKPILIPIPQGYEASASVYAWAKLRGIGESAVRDACDAMVDHAKSKGTMHADWDAALRTWLRREPSMRRTEISGRPLQHAGTPSLGSAGVDCAFCHQPCRGGWTGTSYGKACNACYNAGKHYAKPGAAHA
jgi:hypothetical protein